MIKPYILTIILLFLIILMLILIYKNKFDEHFSRQHTSSHLHNRKTCKYPYTNQHIGLSDDDENTHYPFHDDDECSLENQNLDIVDVHVNNNVEFGLRRNIHLVNPYNACCLRTCINDFTDVDKPDGPLRDDFIGPDKSLVNLHYFFTSKCNECIENHWKPIKLLHEAKVCPNN
jgi:hypothetical protein